MPAAPLGRRPLKSVVSAEDGPPAGVGPRLRILFAAPAYWPAMAFGGPIAAGRELNEGMVSRGHHVEVVTTTLVDLERERTFRGRSYNVSGVQVHALATPARYRWMGITPTLPLWLARARRPDIVHLFGFRDVVTTCVAAWSRHRGIPYVFEPLGMFEPRVRKVRLKKVFDATVAAPVARSAAAIVVTSEREGRTVIEAGAPSNLIRVRGNGFPTVTPSPERPGRLRRSLGLLDEPIVLSVGRIASGKGIELLLDVMTELPTAHLVLAGPDDGHGVGRAIDRAARSGATAGRIHQLGPVDQPLDLYPDADVFVLPSEGESFGMVAAEAAAAGTPVVVTDRCGVSEVLGPDGALVVSNDRASLLDAVTSVLADPVVAGGLSTRGREIAAANAWPVIVERQEQIYREALAARA
jgi:glycosyltransferase involved in cell wall biosynthesis